MTFYLVHRDGKALVATDRPLLKAREADRLSDAAALLTHAQKLETEALSRRDAAEAEAQRRGFVQGHESGRRVFVEAVGNLTGQVEAWRQHQESQIAALALAALRRMVDDIGDEAMMIGIARRAVAAVTTGAEAQVHAAPELVDVLSEALAAREDTAQVTVRPDPELGLHECRVITAEGRIIADLSVQLAEIEKRWSLSHVD